MIAWALRQIREIGRSIDAAHREAEAARIELEPAGVHEPIGTCIERLPAPHATREISDDEAATLFEAITNADKIDPARPTTPQERMAVTVLITFVDGILKDRKEITCSRHS